MLYVHFNVYLAGSCLINFLKAILSMKLAALATNPLLVPVFYQLEFLPVSLAQLVLGAPPFLLVVTAGRYKLLTC
jgi:hypothetical protein